MPDHDPRGFRAQLLNSLRRQRENAIRIRRLAFGPPAPAALIERIERERLGFPMPRAMREFFTAHDGASLMFHRIDDLTAEVYDHAVPLAVESEEPIDWGDAMHDGGALWQQIDAADFGGSPEEGFFYAGVFCIPGLAEIFDTDWGAILGWPAGTYLFDSYHPFRFSALVCDRERQAVYIQPTTDHGADRGAAPVPLDEYLATLAGNGGTDRVVDGRMTAVRSHG